MIKSTIYFTLAMLVLSFGSANAQTFSFESKNDTPVVLGGVGADGGGYFATYGTGSGASTSADGTKRKTKSTCVSMMQPPNGNVFAVHVVCDVTGDGGSFSVAAGCTIMNKETNESSCIGGLRGKSGELEGRTGAITWHSKGGMAIGSGQWHE